MTDRQPLFFSRGERRTEVVMENDRVCTFKFKDQSRSLLSLLGYGDRLSCSASAKTLSGLRLYHVCNFNITVLLISL